MGKGSGVFDGCIQTLLFVCFAVYGLMGAHQSRRRPPPPFLTRARRNQTQGPQNTPAAPIGTQFS